MPLYFRPTRSFRMRLAFAALAIAAPVYLSRILIEILIPELLPHNRHFDTYQLDSLIDPALRIVFAVSFITALFIFLKLGAFPTRWQRRSAHIAMIAAAIDLALVLARTAIFALVWFSPRNKPWSDTFSPYDAFLYNADNYLFSQSAQWSFNLSLAVMLVLNFSCLIMVARHRLNIPTFNTDRQWLLRSIVYVLVPVYAIYLVYISGEYLYPYINFAGSRLMQNPTVSVVSAATGLIAAPCLLAIGLIFADAARRPIRIDQPDICNNCDYPLEPSFTTCPECGTTRPATSPPE